MLIKEYRISLPMSVEEYRIAQLYMIQRKSREESHGEGSGVEIITNQPYTEGPGGNGQYTYKIYHIGSHLPGWFRAILPKSALRVEEEAWNAYPYTKTRYRCPFVDKFVLEIETKYLDDGGEKENVFSMTASEMKDRVLDYIDIVKDPLQGSDYKKEEDPKLYLSKMTKRGPLNDNWRKEYCQACKHPNDSGKSIMTAYKLCRVEFKYWGMQNKIERFIHDIGLRKTMLRAHRQAWCWQDEYYGLKLADIRRLERETQLALQQTMADVSDNNEVTDNNIEHTSASDLNKTPLSNTQSEQVTNLNNSNLNKKISTDSPKHPKKIPVSRSFDHVTSESHKGERSHSPSQSSRHSKRSRTNQLTSTKSKSSLDSSQISDWRFQSLEQLQESSSDEEEFFDAQEMIITEDSNSEEDGLCETDVFGSDLELSDSESETFPAWETILIRSSSMETLSVSNDEFADARSQLSFDPEPQVGRRLEKLCQKYSLETGSYNDKHSSVPPLCKINTLFLIIHGGSTLDTADHFNTSKRSDYTTLKSTFDTVVKSHYPAAKGRLALRLVPCPQICAEALSVLSSLSPFGFDTMPPSAGESNLPWSQEFVPLGAVALFSGCSPDYQDHVNSVVAKANLVYIDFLHSDEGKCFNGQVCILADATGSVLTYDALCRSRPTLSRSGSQYGSRSSNINDINEENEAEVSLGSTHTLCDDLSEASDCKTKDRSRTPESREKTPDTDNTKKSENSEKHEKMTTFPDFATFNANKLKQETSGKTVLEKSESVTESMLRGTSGRHNSVRLNVSQSMDGAGSSGEYMRRTSSGSQYECLKFDFEVGDFFMLGSPLGLVMAYRRVFAGENKASPVRPDCQQMYNLFHASDPSAFRIEPLVNFVFKQIPPIKIARYNKYPMGDGESIQIVETMCHYLHMFSDQLTSGMTSMSAQLLLSLQRQASVTSTCSQLSMMSSPGITNIANVSSKWWGNKRIDYMLYCPEVLHSFPVRALPPLFHASFWESTDVAAFVLRQVLQQDMGDVDDLDTPQSLSPRASYDGQPKEKWQKRRTMYKVRNLQPNHRGNDVLVLEDKAQVLSGKFMYGPLDMTSLSGEKTDIHVMSSTGEWTFMGTELTDGHGRLNFTIPKDKRLSQGIHAVKMVVRVDHTTADMFLTVLPPRTEMVIFSIDGSFTASVSIMGKDPKVKPGAVDVVRHWQELGYLILYVTARPDMQHNKVVGWLAQHNFPHGMVAFMDGFSKDPLRQKFSYLKHLQTEADMRFRAGYGSSKDVNGYRDLGLKKEQIFIVGKSNKKQQNLATFVSNGYAVHLENLMSPGICRPASGNGIFLLRKSCFSLPAGESKRTSKSRLSASLSVGHSELPSVPGFVRQESSNISPQTLITVSEDGNTLLQPVQPSFGSAVRARGTSPRPKIAFDAPR